MPEVGFQPGLALQDVFGAECSGVAGLAGLRPAMTLSQCHLTSRGIEGEQGRH